MRNALEPPVPISLVLPFLAFKHRHTEVEMRDAVDTLLEELSQHLRQLHGCQQLPLFADEARGEVLEEPCAVGGGNVLALEELVATGTKFPTVYADPPWQYTNRASRAAAENHYRTLSVDQICREPVSELAAENAHLHLWTTNAFLQDAFTVIDAWGFTFKSCLIWVKDELGMGNYWRVSHEFLCDRSHKNSYVVLLFMWCRHGSPRFSGRFWFGWAT